MRTAKALARLDCEDGQLVLTLPGSLCDSLEPKSLALTEMRIIWHSDSGTCLIASKLQLKS